MTYPWGTQRRFNAAVNAIKKEFGSRIQKVALDAGFTCPNRDGTRARGGCTFCNNNAFNPSYCQPAKPVMQQVKEGIRFHENRYKSAGKYMAYFQAYSNTYAPVDRLRELYYEALDHPDVIGLVIGTRPDCVNDEIFKLLQEINEKYHLTVEFGIESVYNETLEAVNRGHSYEETKEAIHKCAQYNIKCGGHMIFGLPGETQQMMMDSAQILSKLPLHSIKFHQLQVIQGTKLGKDYQLNPNNYHLFSMEEYIDFMVEYLGIFTPNIIIERLAGEAQPSLNIGKEWKIRYDQVLQKIEKRMEELDVWQGKYYIR